MRAKKSKAKKIYEKIRQKTYKNLLDQMEIDKQTAGTDEWKQTSVHQTIHQQRQGIDYLNFTWLCIEYVMKIIDQQWNSKHNLYKNRNHWDEKILNIHGLKIRRMIVLEMIPFTTNKKYIFERFSFFC